MGEISSVTRDAAGAKWATVCLFCFRSLRAGEIMASEGGGSFDHMIHLCSGM